METIIAVDKNERGEIISFKTDTKRVISYRKALQDIEAGRITGAKIIEDDFSNLPKILCDSEIGLTGFEKFPPIY